VAEPSKLFRLNCSSHRYTTDTNSTHFKRNNLLVCRVSTRYNHGSTGSKQVYLVRRRVYNHMTAHQLLIDRILNIITNDKLTVCPDSQWKEIHTRLHTSRRLTPRSARSMASFSRVTASRGQIPFHRPAKRNRGWPCWTIRGVLKGHT
jgi:hypothetical protein